MNMRRGGLKITCIAAALSLCTLWGCSKTSKESHIGREKDVIVATVDDGKVTMKDLKREILEVRGFSSTLDVKGATREEIVKALQRLIRQALIIEEAKEMGVDVDDEEVQREIQEIKRDYPEGSFGKLLLKESINEHVWEEKLKRTLLIKKASEIIKDRASPATQKELYTYLANNKIRLKNNVKVPKNWHLKEYVFITKDDAERARQLVENSDGERDEEIIRSALIPVTIYDLGFLSRKGIGKDYVKEVTSLEKDQISQIVKLPSSYAFFRILDIRPEHIRKKEEAIEEVKKKISTQKREEYLSQWLQKRFNEAAIKINEASLGKLEGVKTGKNE